MNMYNVYIVYYKDVLWLGMRMICSFLPYYYKNDIYASYIINKQQQQSSKAAKQLSQGS